MTRTTTDLDRYTVSVTLTDLKHCSSDPNAITIEIPATSAEAAAKFGNKLAYEISDATDNRLALPIGTRFVTVTPAPPSELLAEPDTCGPREGHLRDEAKRGGFPISEADIAHVRHLDNCRTCQETEEEQRTQYKHEQALENSRHALLNLLYQIQNSLEVARRRAAAGDPVPSEEWIEKLTKAARAASAAHQRALKGDR